MAMQYTDEDIEQMVKDVRHALLGPATLSKSEAPSPGMLKKDDPAEGPPKEDSSPAPEASGSPDASAPPSDGPPPDMGGGSPEDPGADPAAGGQMDIGQLQQEYAALSDEEIHMHFEALKGEMFNRMGSQDPATGGAPPGVDPSMGAAPGAGPGMGAPPPADPSPPAMVPNGDPSMGKSEKNFLFQDLAKSQDLKIETLSKSVDLLTNLITEMVSAPKRKTITNLADFQALSKTEPSAKKLDSKEIQKKLSKVVEQRDLSKSDRELITRATLSGIGRGGNSVKFEEIEHLLK